MGSLAAEGKKLASLAGMMEEVVEMSRKHWNKISSIQKFQELVKKSTALIEDTKSASVVALDAKMLYAGSELIASNVTSFETNLLSINPDEYNAGILNYLKNNADELPPEKSWKSFAPVTYHLYSKSDAPVSMLGSVFLDPEPVAVKTKRVERMKKVSETRAIVLADSTQDTPNENDEIQDGVYEHILKSLVRSYKSNAKEPLNFIEFIVNPNDYWNSIQNIFYFSFLVRDGRVKMSINGDGLAVVEPVFGKDLPTQKKKENTGRGKGKGAAEKNIKNNQFIFTLSMKQWKECVQKLKTKVPMIKPLDKK